MHAGQTHVQASKRRQLVLHLRQAVGEVEPERRDGDPLPQRRTFAHPKLGHLHGARDSASRLARLRPPRILALKHLTALTRSERDAIKVLPFNAPLLVLASLLT